MDLGFNNEASMLRSGRNRSLGLTILKADALPVGFDIAKDAIPSEVCDY